MVALNILFASLIVTASGLLMAPEIHAAQSPCKQCEKIDGYVSPKAIDSKTRKLFVISGGSKKIIATQKARGVVETGLYPEFIKGAKCPDIDGEGWAIDYTKKNRKPELHKGIDIPQPSGTPILAIADGTVVGKFMNAFNSKGIEIMLRHTPKQTGLKYWTYSQYTRLIEMSPLRIGTKVRMGTKIGRTSNSGAMGKRTRRDALHFAILYSFHPQWSNDGVVILPKKGYFMDPNAFYRLEPPYKSHALASLPKDQKKVAMPYMKRNGKFEPANTKRIWPYRCK